MVSEKTKLSIGNISTHLNHASYSLGNQTNLTIAICKERSESFDCKNTRSKGKVQTNVSRDFSPLDRANSTNDRQLKSIIELLTHLNHSITDSNNNHWFKMSTARKETFTSAVGILNRTNERSIQTAINSEKSYLLFDLYNSSVLPTYSAQGSWLLWRAK